MLIKGTALVWFDEDEMELSEGGIVFLPKNVPHAYRITSKTADLLMINTLAGIEGCSGMRAAIGEPRVPKVSRYPSAGWPRRRRGSGTSSLGPPC